MIRSANLKKILLIVLIMGCEESAEPEGRGGVIITFDDRSINNWYSHRNYYLNNNIKCTFFLSNIHDYTNDEINMLIELHNDGHELAYHGTHHINANEYLQDHTLQEYLDYEILPDLFIMDSLLTYPISFAYPYGARNDSLDQYLFAYFEILRGTAYNNQILKNIEDLESVFVTLDETNTLVHGVGIDSIYNNSFDDVQGGLNRANNNNEIIIFYLHNIGGDNIYHINFEFFDQIINYVNNLDMPILTISQINSANDIP